MFRGREGGTAVRERARADSGSLSPRVDERAHHRTSEDRGPEPQVGDKEATGAEPVLPKGTAFLVGFMIVNHGGMGLGLQPVYLVAGPSSEDDDLADDEPSSTGCPFGLDCAARGCPNARGGS